MLSDGNEEPGDAIDSLNKEQGEDVSVVGMNVMIVRNKQQPFPYTQNAVKQFAVWL